MGASDFETKDSGERQHFDSGMQRDTEDGKPRFDLLVPEGVAFEDQLLTRFAALMGRGAVKYNARNWEKANSEDEVARAKSSAFRHFFQWFCGETDEDHAAATLFNIMVVETITPRIEQEPEIVTVGIRVDTGSSSDIPAGIGDLTEDLDEPIDLGSAQVAERPLTWVDGYDTPGAIQIHIHAIDEKARQVTAADLIHESMNRVRREDLRF